MSEHKRQYVRFNIAQRIEHLILILSFTILAITGLSQKYAGADISQSIIAGLGGIELTRIIHRWAATVFVLQSIYHFVIAGYKVFVKRYEATMLPSVKDGKDAIQSFFYNLGLSKAPPKMPRYNFMEKMEYWAMIWGLVLMGVTGFMLWNPILTARILPGQFIPTAKVAHGLEAVLAVLAILIWHFYNVHIKHWNWSMIKGTMDRHQMEEEHAEELEKIEAGKHMPAKVAPEVTRRRALIYWPIALVIAAALVGGIIWLITAENTALAFVPPPEPNIPAVSTPVVTATAAEAGTSEAPTAEAPAESPTEGAEAPTQAAPAGGGATTSMTWSSGISELFDSKCASCHGAAAMGGVALDTYSGTLQHVTPNNADQSQVVTVQRAGGHPGMFTPEELQQVIDWINAGAPEQ